RELLAARERGHLLEVVARHQIVRRGNVHARLLHEAGQMTAALREKDGVHLHPRQLLRAHDRGMRAITRRLEVDHLALDDPARGALAEPHDVELPATEYLADQDGNLGRADFDGADEVAFGCHGETMGMGGGTEERSAALEPRAGFTD